ncbi:LysM peptidoglycan-binding domain-containing protein [Neoroseomonas lacus]|uniref:LysM domain-containing protein n=1 Tax=Neoroseomonas lacus TaxID=287609 RepID=A0A917KFG2_9PROT|nr:LysM peptidoglycan-binding domain-containing protein [Neoroseomonas lacus]GGJ12095.1 hypothetical protein GCM10011320_19100 [Neoroseomonas lacus]
MRPTALLGLGGFALLAALIYGLWPSVEVPPASSVAVAPPPAATPDSARTITPPATVAPAPASAADQSATPPHAATAPVPAAAAPIAATATTTAATSPAAAPAAAAPVPRFDVVRVGARGSAVVAGRAAPGAEVLLIVDGGRELGRARADGRGEWVILPADPLPSGAWELSLRSRIAGEETAGPDAVVVVVPEAAPSQAGRGVTAAAESTRPADTAAEAGSGPIAVLIPSAAAAAPPRILQGPQVAAPVGHARAAAPSLGMDSVDYEEGGTIRFAGSAPPGAAVRVYVGSRHAGDAVADAAGRWTLAPDEQPPVGRNSLRVDQVAASGAVAARVEVPFQRDALPANAFDTHRVVVQPGTNLWRIARATYGRGTRFTTIYQANRDQIRDPRLIFPGQIFDLPEAQAAPSASSVSR